MEKEKEEKDIKDTEQTSQQPGDSGTETSAEEEAESGQAAEAAQPAEEPAEAAEPTPEETIASLQGQIDEWKDKYLRQAAEFDNYRKRVVKEKSELIMNGGQRVIQTILPIIDDFERAQAGMDKLEDVKAAQEGVRLIIEKFLKLLAQEGLKPIEAVGQPFDVDFHEAVAMIPAQEDDQKGKVVDCIQTGYMLNEKVIRHAKVAVAQ